MKLFDNYIEQFNDTHKSNLNIFLHIISGIIGLFGMINLLPYNYIFCILYVFHLNFLIPKKILCNTAFCITTLLFISYFYIINIYQYLYLLLFSFILEEFSHILKKL